MLARFRNWIRRIQPTAPRQGIAHQPIQIRELEKRILYSATPFPADPELAGADGPEPIGDPHVNFDANLFLTTPEPGQSELRELFLSLDATADESLEPQPDDLNSGEDLTEEVESYIPDLAGGNPLELVFVDSSLEDYESMLADIRSQVEEGRDLVVIELKNDRDGIQQISESLAGFGNVSAMHIVSHGSAGEVNLGNTWLSMENLPAYAGEIAGWEDSLVSGADLLIYGCELASNDSGVELVDALSALCDCDVAASDDRTGHASLGGDWEFEFLAGSVETELAFTESLQASWAGILAPNQAPVNAVPGTQDATLGFTEVLSTSNGNAVGISDADAGTNDVEVTLSVDNGTLTLSGTNDLTFSAGDGADDSTMTFTGKVADINTALDGLGYDAAAIGTATITVTTDDLGNTGTGGPQTDVDVISVEVSPRATVFDQFNAASFAGNDGTHLWSNAWQEIGEGNGANAGSVSVYSGTHGMGLHISNSANGVWREVDLSGANSAILSFDYARQWLDDPADFVSLELSSNGGSSWTEIDRFEGPAIDWPTKFAKYDVSDFISSNTQIRFVSSGFGGGDALFVDNVEIEYSAENVGELWFTTTGNGGGGGATWTDSEVVQFGDHGDAFELESGLTSGSNVKLPNFSAPADIRAMHHVESNLTIGTAPNDFDLQPGDLVLTLDPGGGPATVTLNSGGPNQFDADRQDIVVFRPESIYNYAEADGEWFMLLNDGVDDGGPSMNIHGLSLVEAETTVGGTTLNKGDFLVTHSNPNHQNIATLRITGTGEFTSSADPIQNLLTGADLGNSGDQIQGLHLLQQDTWFGSSQLAGGTLLVQVNADGSYAGVPHDTFDVLALTVSQTEQDGVPGTAATGVHLFDGWDMGLTNTADESLNGFTVVSSFFTAGNSPPTFTSSLAPSVDENQTVVQTLTANDPDLDPIIFSITGGADQGLFNINGSNQLEFLSAPDFEIPADANTNNVYEVEVTADDGRAGVTVESISVTVNPLNDNNPVFTSGATQSLSENQTVVHELTATDADLPGDTITFTINGTGADDALFTVNGSNELAFVAAPDFETPGDVGADNVYDVDVLADDGNGGTIVQSVAVTVLDVGGVVVVDTTADVSDGDTTSIESLVANRGADGKISLREAIAAANNTTNDGSPDEIHFNFDDADANHLYYQQDFISDSLSNIASTSVNDASITDFDPDHPYSQHSWFRIDLNNALPQLEITDDVIIDGFTQAGTAANTLSVGNDAVMRVELTSSGADSNRGLTVESGGSGSTIKGLVINGFDNSGIMVEPDADNVTIQGNFIGTDITGTQDLGNGDAGVHLRASGALVGGVSVADRNLISGNENRGVTTFTFGPIESGNVIRNNYIGVDATGLDVIGNSGTAGVQVFNNDGLQLLDNVIGGQSGIGVHLMNSTVVSNTTIQGNQIGVGADGVTAVGNSDHGIWIEEATVNTTIGGTGVGEGNIIANNSGDGISLSAGSGTEIRGNQFYANSGLAIDINDDGVTANDVGDSDGGVNNRQNFPVLSSATVSGVDLDVTGNLNSTAGTTFDIDFYASTSADGSGHGEAERYLGSVQVTTDGSGDAVINTSLIGVSVTTGEFVTATATDPNGSTSEFSLNVAAAGNSPPTFTSGSSQNLDENSNVVHSLTASDPNLDSVSFSINGTGADDALFVVNGSDQLEFLAAPDFESPGDAGTNNVYNVDVLADDGNGGATVQSIVVSVNDLNDVTPVVDTLQSFAVDEDATVGTSLGFATASDPDTVGSLINWAITDGNSDGIFAIDSTTGELTIADDTNLDFEAKDNYTLEIQVEDGVSLSSQEDVEVTINDVNEFPTITTISDTTILESGTTGEIAFNIGDPETSSGSLTVTATSSNQTIIPDGNLTITGSGSSRDIELNAANGQTGGPVTITVSVDDGLNVTQESFDVTVIPRVITVTTTLDENDGDTDDILTLLLNPGGSGVSLREAIIATNNTNIGTTPDQIVLPSGTYLLFGSGDDSGNNGDLDVRDDLILSGGGARTTTIDAQGNDRVFDLRDNSDVTISGLAITGGSDSGIEVHSGTSLSLIDSAVVSNAGSRGGGIDSDGSLTLNRVLIAGNDASDKGGGLYLGSGVADLTNVTISGNTADDDGGAIWTKASLTILNSTLANNSSPTTAGIHVDGGTVSITNSILSNNGLNANVGLASGDYNIDSDGSAALGGANDVVGDPFLNALADNGGPTDTHSLMTGSAGVNPIGLGGAPAVDQRGVARGANPDIGAYEGAQGSAIGVISDIDVTANELAENSTPGTNVGVTALAVDVDLGDSVTYALANNAGGRFGIHSLTGVVSLVGTVDFEASPSHTIVVRATSTDGSSRTRSFVINVQDVNETPIANHDSYSSIGDTISVGAPGILANDMDPEGAGLTVTLVSGPGNGTLFLNGNGSFTFVADTGFAGTDSFVYEISDGFHGSVSATVNLTVVGAVLPAAPAAVADPVAEPDSDPDAESDGDSDPVDKSEPAVEPAAPAAPTQPVSTKTLPVDPGSLSPEAVAASTNSSDTESESDESVLEVVTDYQEYQYQRTIQRGENRFERYGTSGSEFDVGNRISQEIIAADYVKNLNEMRDEVVQEQLFHQALITTSVAAGSTLSVGYVVWMIRGGVLLSSVLSSLPAWQMIDPLPILGGGSGEEDVEDDSLESMVEKSNAKDSSGAVDNDPLAV